MRLVLQRVSEASVTAGGVTVGSIRTGLLILAGMAKTDTNSGGGLSCGQGPGIANLPRQCRKNEPEYRRCRRIAS